MSTQARNTSVVHVDNIDIPVTEYQNLRVITTELMAQVYGTELNNIQANFIRNKDRFEEEGKHFFKLEGKRLTDLKSVSPQINKRTRNLILWTERGAARHAKMLDTDQAWDVFDKLEAAYFEPPQEPQTSNAPRGSLNDPDYLKESREKLHHYADACIAAVQSTGAKVPQFPTLADGIIDGLIAEKIRHARLLVSFSPDFELELEQVPPQSCVIDPENIISIKTVLNECIPVELMPDVINTSSQRLGRHIKRKN